MKNRIIPEILTISAGSSLYVSSSKASGRGVAYARTADQHLLAENAPVTLDAKVLFLDDGTTHLERARLAFKFGNGDNVEIDGPARDELLTRVVEALTAWKVAGSPLARATGTIPASSVVDLATRAAAEAELGAAHEALRAARDLLASATRDERLAAARVKRAVDVVKGFRPGLESNTGFALSNEYGAFAVLAGTDRALAERLRNALTETSSSKWSINEGCGRDGSWGDPLVAFGNGASVSVYDEAGVASLVAASAHPEPAGLFSGFHMGPRA